MKIKFRTQIAGTNVPHYISIMSSKLYNLGGCFNIPENTSHISGGSNHFLFSQETAARKVASMTTQLPQNSDRGISCFQVVNTANVIQPTTSNL